MPGYKRTLNSPAWGLFDLEGQVVATIRAPTKEQAKAKLSKGYREDRLFPPGVYQLKKIDDGLDKPS